jgi:class 3 adenylate cyclase
LALVPARNWHGKHAEQPIAAANRRLTRTTDPTRICLERPKSLSVAALGNPVNVVARLQDMTKGLECEVILAEDVLITAGLVPGPLARQDVPIRGRDGPMTIRFAAKASALSALLS